ncbi:hypothetical protein KY359_04035 [Candidatus Woesearchaeota archaeon]|nr:hypothetical protein [Candidatus Woesearchaeota archaeon]
MPLIKTQDIHEKLTFVCHHSLVDGYLTRKDIKISPPTEHARKPEGYWVSVDYSWEHYCKSGFESKLAEHVQLDVHLKAGHPVFRVDSIEDLRQMFILAEEPAFGDDEALAGSVMKVFDRLKHKGRIHGVYLSRKGLESVGKILVWDIPSIVLFSPDAIMYSRRRDRYLEDAISMILRVLDRLLESNEVKQFYLRWKRSAYREIGSAKFQEHANRNMADVVARMKTADPKQFRSIVSSLMPRKLLFFRPKPPEDLVTLLTHFAGRGGDDENRIEEVLRRIKASSAQVNTCVSLCSGLQKRLEALKNLPYESKDMEGIERVGQILSALADSFGRLRNDLMKQQNAIEDNDLFSFIRSVDSENRGISGLEEVMADLKKLKKDADDLRAGKDALDALQDVA